MKISKLFPFATLLVSILPAFAKANTDAIKSIDIYVLPYYSAENGKANFVNVYSKIDSLLLKNTIDGYKKAVKIVEKNTDLVTPMTLFTLSARAYDLGLRDESVFWFYIGRQRLLVIDHVADFSKMKMAEYAGFMTLVRTPVMAYAFCDFNKQQKILAEAYEWTKNNPYKALLLPQIPSKFTDRKQGLEDAQKMLEKRYKEQQDLFNDPKTQAKIKQSRKENNTDAKFCW